MILGRVIGLGDEHISSRACFNTIISPSSNTALASHTLLSSQAWVVAALSPSSHPHQLTINTTMQTPLL